LAGCGKVDIIGPKAEIMFNLAEIHVDVQGEFFIFNPSVGSMLTGMILFYLSCIGIIISNNLIRNCE